MYTIQNEIYKFRHIVWFLATLSSGIQVPVLTLHTTSFHETSLKSIVKLVIKQYNYLHSPMFHYETRSIERCPHRSHMQSGSLINFAPTGLVIIMATLQSTWYWWRKTSCAPPSCSSHKDGYPGRTTNITQASRIAWKKLIPNVGFEHPLGKPTLRRPKPHTNNTISL